MPIMIDETQQSDAKKFKLSNFRKEIAFAIGSRPELGSLFPFVTRLEQGREGAVCPSFPLDSNPELPYSTKMNSLLLFFRCAVSGHHTLSPQWLVNCDSPMPIPETRELEIPLVIR